MSSTITGVRHFAATRSAAVAVLVLLGLMFVPAAPGAQRPPPSADRVDFNRDVRPIFSDICFACHGPDDSKRKSGLRLDLRDAALKPAKSGAVAIVPGHADQSELVKRVSSHDPDEVMPPARSGKKLSAAQVALLRRWVDEGAEYKEHWAFVPPTRPALPQVPNQAWPRNGIDYFIQARLARDGLKPSREADKTTLIRRATLDLTGLPPTPAEVDVFLADRRSDAYERLVDRLLDSPHYGERMALEWLDAARYADTHGYHIDSARYMSSWRDGVIDAFNQNRRFDQFTLEQLAGDLLPNATQEQRLASGFNRNHMINFEGGAIPEEYHAAYLMDRVNTTATVWLGLTLACAQCHDHKYDPLTMKEYYRFYAYFNSVPESGLDGGRGNAVPLMKVPTKSQRAELARLESDVLTAEAALKAGEDSLPAAQARWEQASLSRDAGLVEPAGLLLRFALDGTLEGQQPGSNSVAATPKGSAAPKWVPGISGQALELPGTAGSYIQTAATLQLERTNAFSYGGWVNYSGDTAAALLAKMDDGAKLRGFDLLIGGGKLHLHLVHSYPANALRVLTRSQVPRDRWSHVFATYDGSSKASGVKLYIDGQAVPIEASDDTLSESIDTTTPLNLGQRSASHPFKGGLDDVRVYGRVLPASEVAALVEAQLLAHLRVPVAERTDAQKKLLTGFFRDTQAPAWRQASEAAARARKARDDFNKGLPDSMVMGEMDKPRDTFLLIRGQYDKKGEKVTPGTPAVLPPLPKDAPANRLALARWLVSPGHPLTARVTVNRYWQMYFGNGIVKTAENFGSQADWPSHPELLDWLATEFIRTGWDVKAMQKLILTSAAYRQSSVVTRELVEHDPENRLLARGPRLRLPGEFIRDQALAISGLLNPAIGGPSVFPYQPAGLWEELMARADGDNFTAQKYRQSTGADLYRRSIYTFWKRTSPPPTLGTLDAPDRQTCVVRRQRTNTPLQALLLMNDPTYVEAARKLAERMMTGARDERGRLELAFRLAMARPPTSAESKVLLKLYRDQVASGKLNPAAASALLHVGESQVNPALDPVQWAAWTLVASAILNLDETITKG